MPKQTPHSFHPLHARRVVWVAIVVAGLLFIQCIYNIRTTGQPHVLAYAATMSQQELLAATNAYRQDAGLPPLKLNDKLSRGAQAKARDMIQRNYWAHITPDGQLPWQFFDKAGYSYAAAGENLAYGFSTASETVAGWMNSPEHRSNLLGNYTDVGFGYASGADYQHGPNTVIVAFYGAPLAGAVTTASANKPSAAAQSAAPEITEQSNGLSIIAGGHANWAVYASLGLIVAAAVGFAITHLELVRQGWYKHKRSTKLHAFCDAALLMGSFMLIVQATAGFIK